jgi:hypothetical protein
MSFSWCEGGRRGEIRAVRETRGAVEEEKGATRKFEWQEIDRGGRISEERSKGGRSDGRGRISEEGRMGGRR